MKNKYRALTVMVLIVLFLGGCVQTTRLVGDILSQQTRQTEYDRQYKKALAQGKSEAEARAIAEKAADLKYSRDQQLLSGAANIFSSAGGIDYNSELAIGESLALEGFKHYGLPLDNPELQRYVNLVGNAVARNSLRPDIPYRFVVIDSPVYNAFACPGGIVFVSAKLVRALEDESELAAVLAHEVAHVGHKHALKSIKRARFFDGVAKITTANMKGEKGRQYQQMVGNLQTVMFDKGLDKSMEFEADITGMEMAYRTGYDPAAIIRVLTTLQRQAGGAKKAGSWYSTHPPLENRLSRCHKQLTNYPDSATLARVNDRFNRYRKSLR